MKSYCFNQQLKLNTLYLFLIFSLALFQQILAVDFSQGGNEWTGTCKTGLLQSPIDIRDVQGSCDNTMNLTFQFSNEPIKTRSTTDQSEIRSYAYGVDDNTVNPVVKVQKYWSFLYASNIDGVISSYRSTEFRIKVPAENYIDGSRADVEIQFIHKINEEFKQTAGSSKIKGYAIVSIMFNEHSTEKSTFFTQYDVLKTGSNVNAEIQTLNLTSSFTDQLDLSGQYYFYEGSLTIPDCDENVNWYVYSQILPVNNSQLKDLKSQFTNQINGNQLRGSRNLQPINGKKIKKGNIQCEEQFIHFFSFFILYTFLIFFVCKIL